MAEHNEHDANLFRSLICSLKDGRIVIANDFVLMSKEAYDEISMKRYQAEDEIKEIKAELEWYKVKYTMKIKIPRTNNMGCEFCKTELYIKTIQYTKPILKPLTYEQELRDKLLDLTGEVYVKIENTYCPFCGEKIHKK